MINNCLFIAIYKKLTNKSVKIYMVKSKTSDGELPHFVWEMDNKYFHFTSLNKKLPWYKSFLFKGEIKEWKFEYFKHCRYWRII